MLRWHASECDRPHVQVFGGDPSCLSCGMTVSMLEDEAVATDTGHDIFDIPTSDPMNLNLTWPSCVKYYDYAEESVSYDSAGGGTADGSLNLEHGPPGSCVNSPSANTPSTSIRKQPTQSRPTLVPPKNLSTTHIEFPSFDSLGQIRLLKIMKGRNSDPLHGNLIIVPLFQHSQANSHTGDRNVSTEYEALSYTWADEHGDHTKTRRIFIGKSWDILGITANCEKAISRLRLLDFDRLMWIDSVCIDQSDKQERSHQVGLMREIYSHAKQVIVYLGEKSDDSDLAVLAMHWRQFGYGHDIDDHERRALQKLFKRQYFNRLWIVQEFLSAKIVHIICGSEAATLLPRDNPVWEFAIQEGQCPAWIDGHYTGHVTPTEYLRELLVKTRETFCLDPRDKLFGLLGLVPWADNGQLYADYLISTVEMRIGLAAYFAQVTDGLDCILKIRDDSRVGELSDLPQWVPDFSISDITKNFVTASKGAIFRLPYHEIFLGKEASEPGPHCQTLKRSGALLVDAIELCPLQGWFGLLDDHHFLRESFMESQDPEKRNETVVLADQARNVVILMQSNVITARQTFPEDNDFVFMLRDSTSCVILRHIRGSTPRRYLLLSSCRIFYKLGPPLGSLWYPGYTECEVFVLDFVGSRLAEVEHLSRKLWEYFLVSVRGTRDDFLGNHVGELVRNDKSISEEAHTNAAMCLYFASFHNGTISRSAEYPAEDSSLETNSFLAGIWNIVCQSLPCGSSADANHHRFSEKLRSDIYLWKIFGTQRNLAETERILLI